MSKQAPDHHDAELVLRAYELRRETVMRQSRNAINGQFWPKSYDDILALVQPTHPLNAAWRQVSSYWELIYNMPRHGIVNAEYFAESNGEGLLLYAKIEPFLKQFRDQFSATAFRNAEWIATETAAGREILARFRARIAMMQKQAAAAPAAPLAKAKGSLVSRLKGKRKR